VLEAASEVGAAQLKEFVLARVVKDFAHIMRTQGEQVHELPKPLLIDIMTALAHSMSPSPPSASSAMPHLPSASPSPSSSPSTQLPLGSLVFSSSSSDIPSAPNLPRN